MESAATPATASTFFDSQDQAAFQGTRGAADAPQLVMLAEAFDIHVRVSGVPPKREIAGQMLARETTVSVSGVRLRLLGDGEYLATTKSDKIGEFRFSDVPEGVLSLQIDLPHLTVVGTLNPDGSSDR